MRLRPLTDAVAKPALPVLDVPLGAWGLSALKRGASPVVVNASHAAETVASALGIDASRSSDNVRLMLERPDPLGTGGTLRALRGEVSGRVVTWNSDSLTDVDLDALVESHRAGGALATIAVASTPDDADFEVDDGRVVRLIDRRTESRAGARFIGVAVYERSALDTLADLVPLGATEALLVPLLERNELRAFEHRGYALDVGTPARYLTANEDALSGRAPTPPRSFPGDTAAVVGGRAYLGPRARANTGSLGPGAIVLASAEVHPAARVVNSVVMPGERVPAGTTVQSCIWFGGRALPVRNLGSTTAS